MESDYLNYVPSLQEHHFTLFVFNTTSVFDNRGIEMIFSHEIADQYIELEKYWIQITKWLRNSIALMVA